MSSQTPLQEEKKSKKSNPGSGWFGLVLIVLGIIFFAQQIGNFEFTNWWAVFILIPAFSAFGSSFRMWQRDGRFHFGVWSAFYGGLFPLMVALMFFFNLDWGKYWPVFVILPGFGTMISGLPFPRPEDIKVPTALLRHRPWPFFIGLSALLLGITFLGRNLDLFDATSLVPFENWWGVFILIAALGGLFTGLLLIIGQHSWILIVVNLAGAAAVGLAGVIAIFELDWGLMDMVTPVILILIGVGLLVGFGRQKGPE
jgi:hypothetical protein